MPNIHRLFITLGFSLTVSGHSLHAAASRVAYVDPFATARGNAFTATADNPSAVFYNAAGLTQIEGTQIQANVFSISLENEYEGPGGSARTDDRFQTIPSLFASHNFEDRPIAIGFGIYAPFALGTDWGSDAPFSAFSTEAELSYIKFHPTIAWQVTETFSIAIGPTFDQSDLRLERRFVSPLGELGEFEFDGDNTTFGWSISARWQPNEKHAFGINYQANTEIDYEGRTDLIAPNGQGGFVPIREDSEASLDFPESIVIGYSYRPTPQWNLEVNVDWTNWDRVDTVFLQGDISGTTPFPLNFESSFIYEAGVTRYFDNGYHLSAGYTYVENSVPDDDFTPAVPDGDRHFLAVGIGGEHGQFTWQATYQIAFGDDRSVNGSGPAGSTDPFQTQTADGEYGLDSQAVAFSIGYRW